MLNKLEQLLGSDWEVAEVDKVGGYKQFVCKHLKGTYSSPWFKELSLGNLVYVARMCHQLVQEEEVEIG